MSLTRSVFKLSTSARLGGESEKDKKRSPDEPEYHCAKCKPRYIYGFRIVLEILKNFLKFQFLEFFFCRFLEFLN